LGGLHNLIHSIRVYNENSRNVFEGFAKFKQIEGDLKAIGMSLTDFYRILHKTSKHLHCTNDGLGHLVNNANRLCEISSRLITSRLSMIEKVGRHQDSQRVSNATELREVVIDILKRSTVFRVLADEKHSYIWISHDLDSAIFREIRAKILVAFIFKRGRGRLGHRELEKVAQKKEFELSCQHHFCNTIAFVANAEYEEEAKEALRSSLGSTSNVFCLTLNDIVEVYESRDRIAKLEDILLRN
jgi:hypothetical protein